MGVLFFLERAFVSSLHFLFCSESMISLISPKKPVPESERGCETVCECLMMEIMMFRAGPERDPIVKRPWKVIAGMGIDRLPKTEADPDKHRDQVEVGEHAQRHRAEESTRPKNEHLHWMSVFGSQTDRSLEFMVLFVDILVKIMRMEEPMEDIMEEILDDHAY